VGQVLTHRILRHAAEMSLSAAEDARVCDRLARAQREAKVRAMGIIVDSLLLIRSTVTLAVFAAMLTRTSPWMVAAVTVAAVPGFWASAALAEAGFRLTQRQTTEGRILGYLEMLLTQQWAAKEVKTFGLAPRLLRQHGELFEKLYREDVGLARRRALSAGLLHTLSLGVLYGCFVVVTWRAAAGRITLGELTLYLFVLREWEGAFTGFLNALRDLREKALFMRDLFGFLHDAALLEPRPAAPAPVPTGGAIEFEDVWFAYPGAPADAPDRWALRGVTLRIAPGERVAFVGKNGAGKSTLVKLLLGFYHPDRGAVRIGGVDVRDLDPRLLRARFGVLFQDYVRYQTTARENILYGDLESPAAPARMPFAATLAGLAPVLDRLPLGVDSKLGRWLHEDGTELSGGEWQKVSLTRAFMRETSFLVLDEPTAALDPEAEHDLFLRLRDLMAGRTTLLISHRIKTVRLADRIVVLDGGEIIEGGRHEELLARGGRYAHLWRLHEQPLTGVEVRVEEPAPARRGP
jgi:ATP-binding cassette subfamily B protein